MVEPSAIVGGADPNPLRVSVVTPAFNEAANLPTLYSRLKSVFDAIEVDWEWLIVDDNSRDNTSQVVEGMAAEDARVKSIRLSRNFGSHMAICCGLDYSEGDVSVVMASDLQDPPEVIPQLIAAWKDGSRVVWAVRRNRPDQTALDHLLSKAFFNILTRMGSIRYFPPTGADFALIDRSVVLAVRQCRERNLSLFPLIAWTGFSQTQIPYDKEPRFAGSSGWTISKKIGIALDTFFSFTYLPIRLMSCLGLATAVLGLSYAVVVVVNAVVGKPTVGWSSLMTATLLLSGSLMMMMGVLGEYMWRALDEARGRPRYIVERTVGKMGQKSR
jgi:dolichol-phosphate mannosyltransferase